MQFAAYPYYKNIVKEKKNFSYSHFPKNEDILRLLIECFPKLNPLSIASEVLLTNHLLLAKKPSPKHILEFFYL